MTLFDAITAERSLLEAWRRVRRNAVASDGDSIAIGRFQGALAGNLARLRAELLAGRYRPGRLHRHAIAKPDGGERWLSIPPVRDRVVQAAVAAALDRIIDPHLSDASFAYRRGRSVAHAVGRIVTYRLWGAVWVLDGDIERYFDTIPHAPLVARLQGHVACRRTLALIEGWLASFEKCGIGTACGVAQGAPVSPLLANLYLDPVDKAIDTRRTRLVRYADDFVVLCAERRRVEQARDRLERLLTAHGLTLHPAKTRITSFAEGFNFLGHHFRGDRVQPMP